MKRAIVKSISVAVVLLVSACASHRYTVVEPRKKELTDYSILEIRDFKSNLGDRESKELAARFADRLHQKVMKDRLEHPDEVIFDDVVRGINKTEGVLMLDGTIISFEKGSRAKRYFIGFGAGKAYCTIQSIFTDKTKNEQILKLNFDGELSMGLFGGSIDEAVQGVVDAYLDYFDDYFENQRVQVQQVAKEADPAEEAPKLAAIRKDEPITRVSLRRGPAEIINETAITLILEEYNFFELKKNPQGSFVNDLVDNKNGTVTDKATGLMWQKSGSSERLANQHAYNYIKQLNLVRFAGYSDWRMPTLEELASLLERERKSGVHLAPEFDQKQVRCWTTDPCDPNYQYLVGAWLIDFQNGEVSQASWHRMKGRDGGAYSKNQVNFVKAVRSVK